MQCPVCNKTESMFFAFGPDGSSEGVGCEHCRRVWYSESAAEKAQTVMSHALRAFVETQDFPEDAVAKGAHGCDPRFNQLDFDDHYFETGREGSFVFSWSAPEAKEDTDVDA